MSERHIALDLDDTLIHAFFISQQQLDEITTDSKYNYLKGRMKILHIVDINDDDLIGKGNISIVMIVFRPYLQEFLKFLLDYFDHISIWSAGHKRYVRAIESILFSPDNEVYRNKCVKVLTRKDCNEITKTSVLKDLNSKGFNLENTIIIDDNETTFVNNPNNAIHIPAYNPQLKEEHILYDDKSLLKIMEWIKTNYIHKNQDVRTLKLNEIFPKSNKKAS